MNSYFNYEINHTQSKLRRLKLPNKGKHLDGEKTVKTLPAFKLPIVYMYHRHIQPNTRDDTQPIRETAASVTMRLGHTQSTSCLVGPILDNRSIEPVIEDVGEVSVIIEDEVVIEDECVNEEADEIVEKTDIIEEPVIEIIVEEAVEEIIVEEAVEEIIVEEAVEEIVVEKTYIIEEPVIEEVVDVIEEHIIEEVVDVIEEHIIEEVVDVIEEHIIEEVIVEEVIVEEVIVEEVIVEEVIVEEVIVEEPVIEEVVEEIIVEEVLEEPVIEEVLEKIIVEEVVEETVIEEIIVEEIIVKETIVEDIVKDIVVEDIVVEEAVEDIAVEDIAVEDIAVEEVVEEPVIEKDVEEAVEEIIVEEVVEEAVEEIIVEEVVEELVEEIIVEDIVVEEIIVEEAVEEIIEEVVKNIVVEDIDVEDIDAEDIVVEDIVVEDIDAEDIDAEDIVVEDIVVEDIVVDVIKQLPRSRLVAHMVYQYTYQGNKHATGFGDFIRSVYFMLQFTQKYDMAFDITIHKHNIKPYLEYFRNQPDLDNSVQIVRLFETRNYQPVQCRNALEYTYKDVDKELLRFIGQLPIYNNHAHFYLINHPDTRRITYEDKQFVQERIKPTEEVMRCVDHFLVNLRLRKHTFVTFHIRYYDEPLTCITAKFVNQMHYIIQLINRIRANSDTDILLLTSSTVVKKFIVQSVPWVILHFNAVGHTCDSTVPEGSILNTLKDFYAMSYSTHIYSCSVYDHGTGFSKWCAETYNIPYVCYYI